MLQGQLQFLIASGVLTSANIVEIAVDSIEPDKVNLTIVMQVPYPCNYIALTLQV